MLILVDTKLYLSIIYRLIWNFRKNGNWTQYCLESRTEWLQKPHVAREPQFGHHWLILLVAKNRWGWECFSERHTLITDICIHIGFEVFTVVVLKSIIFWDMRPCSPLSFNRRFGGTYRLHLQGRRNRFSKPATTRRWYSSFVFTFITFVHHMYVHWILLLGYTSVLSKYDINEHFII
jgi:hypothetical protein